MMMEAWLLERFDPPLPQGNSFAVFAVFDRARERWLNEAECKRCSDKEFMRQHDERRR